MPSSARRRHEIHVMIAMAIYVVVLLAIWPLARTATAPSVKLACALAPVVPLLYVIGHMAHHILRSDELEQRLHLIGLGFAVVVLSVYGVVTGFLAVSQLLSPEASAAALIWIFPLLMAAYSGARALAGRHYGAGWCDGEGVARHVRWLYAAGVFGAVAGYDWWRGRDGGVAILMAVLALACVTRGLWLRQRHRA